MTGPKMLGFTDIIAGEPGNGKSAIAARLTQTRALAAIADHMVEICIQWQWP